MPAAAMVGIGLLGFVPVGCGAAPLAPAAAVEMEERRLLSPFLTERVVGCEELTIEMTGNFYENVSQPTADGVRRVRAEERDGATVRTTWTNVAGGTAEPFRVRVQRRGGFGEQGPEDSVGTTFLVFQQVRQVIHQDRRPLTLEADASGAEIRLQEKGGPLRKVGALRFRDGVLEVR